MTLSICLVLSNMLNVQIIRSFFESCLCLRDDTFSLHDLDQWCLSYKVQSLAIGYLKYFGVGNKTNWKLVEKIGHIIEIFLKGNLDDRNYYCSLFKMSNNQETCFDSETQRGRFFTSFKFQLFYFLRKKGIIFLSWIVLSSKMQWMIVRYSF